MLYTTICTVYLRLVCSISLLGKVCVCLYLAPCTLSGFWIWIRNSLIAITIGSVCHGRRVAIDWTFLPGTVIVCGHRYEKLQIGVIIGPMCSISHYLMPLLEHNMEVPHWLVETCRCVNPLKFSWIMTGLKIICQQMAATLLGLNNKN